MEDFRLDIVLDKGPGARSIRLHLNRFTLIGATTRAGMLTSPLRSRFGFVARVDFYPPEDLCRIVARSAAILGTELTPDGVSLNPPTIPKKADGSYDFPALARKLRAIKTAFPKVDAVFIAADNTIAYEVIVKTLDATREDGQGNLFPNVAFTQIN